MATQSGVALTQAQRVTVSRSNPLRLLIPAKVG